MPSHPDPALRIRVTGCHFWLTLHTSTTMQRATDTVLLIGSSPRKNGNSDLLLKAAAEGLASQQVASETVFLRDYQYQPCLGCEQCRKDKQCTRLNDGMTLLYPKIEAARGLILASPVHHYNVTSWMKAFIDRLYCYYDFENTKPRRWSSRLAEQNRKAAVIGVCEQVDKHDMGFVMEAMQLPLQALGYEIVASQRVFGVFARGELRNQPQMLEKAKMVGETLARALMVNDAPASDK